MIDYKGTTNLKCINITYEVGKTYTFHGELIKCKQGFHFCEKLENVHEFYPLFDKDTIVLKIEVLGKVIDIDRDKSLTNKFKVLGIIDKSEYHKYSDNIYENKIRLEDSGGYWRTFEYDENNNKIRHEYSSGFWEKYKYDKNNNKIYHEESSGYWQKYKYDQNHNIIDHKYSTGEWYKRKYDQNNNLIEYEDHYGNWWNKEVMPYLKENPYE